MEDEDTPTEVHPVINHRHVRRIKGEKSSRRFCQEMARYNTNKWSGRLPTGVCLRLQCRGMQRNVLKRSRDGGKDELQVRADSSGLLISVSLRKGPPPQELLHQQISCKKEPVRRQCNIFILVWNVEVVPNNNSSRWCHRRPLNPQKS